jgi:prepilin-type N-terminal cleavage/methylation domain-containing protein
MSRQRGFSLIELLIVVAIILIIASIAIPSLLSAKISANAASAVSSIRTLNTAQVTYQSTFPTVGYASALSALGPSAATGCGAAGPTSTNACIVDYTLAVASTPGTAKSGYYFAMGVAVANSVNMGYTVWGRAVSVQSDWSARVLRE